MMDRVKSAESLRFLAGAFEELAKRAEKGEVQLLELAFEPQTETLWDMEVLNGVKCITVRYKEMPSS